MRSRILSLFVTLFFLIGCQLPRLSNHGNPTPVVLSQASSTTQPSTPLSATLPTFTPSQAFIESTPTFPSSFASLRIVFSSEKNIWIWQNGVITPLTSIDHQTQAKISDDGKMIAFERNGLWVINSDGTNERLLVSADDFKTLEPKDPGVWLAQFDWIPHSHILLFNTVLRLSYGLSYTDDLYSVDADTSHWTMLQSPSKGGKFLLSPDGQYLALMTPTAVRTMKIDGKDYKTLLNYPGVMTYSEFSYYAQPIWAGDSRSLMIIIPPQDPINAAPSDQTTIWHLFVDGAPATVVLKLSTKFGNQEIVSPDFSKIVDMRNIGWDNENARTIYEMHISNIDGSKDTIYPIEILSFVTWAPDSEQFVLVSTSIWQYYLGKIEDEPIPLTEPNSTGFSWLDESHFLYIESQKGICEIRLGTIRGSSILLATLEKFLDGCITSYGFAK